MMKCKIFYKTIATTTKKSCGLLTKINKHYLFMFTFQFKMTTTKKVKFYGILVKNQCKTKKLLKNLKC